MKLNASHSITLRLKFPNDETSLSEVTTLFNTLDVHIDTIDIIQADDHTILRDLILYTQSAEHIETIIQKLKSLKNIDVIEVTDRTFSMHHGGKIEIKSKVHIKNHQDLSMAYTPGVARICHAIAENRANTYALTMKRNTVAVITDGTAVLGLGDIGPHAALPVMEGKAMLFKDFANIDAFPICLDTKDTTRIVESIQHIAPVFGAINLEDISAPRCFDIEQKLKEVLDIPVFHDDQHGTAIVLMAAFINALRLTQKDPASIKVVISGVGAAGMACTKMLLDFGVKNIIGCDRKGALTTTRTDLDPSKRHYAELTNPDKISGSLSKAIAGADFFIGLSGPNVLMVEDIKSMHPDPVVFALANPIPEIMPELALPHVAIIATGRSDYPNQINNVLAFPGIFRGALDCHASDINEAMKLAAAYAIANIIEPENLTSDAIIPSVFDTRVVPAVAEAVIDAARKTGVARE